MSNRTNSPAKELITSCQNLTDVLRDKSRVTYLVQSSKTSRLHDLIFSRLVSYYNINTFSSRKVLQIKKIIKWEMLS